MLDLVPIGPKTLLGFVVPIFIVMNPQKGIRQILLGKPMMGRIMGILVKLPLALHLCPIKVLILQISGNASRFSRPNIRNGFI